MSKAPWFKFFAGDYMSSPFVQALDPEQELWYVRLIIASAISLPRGCLPLANGKLWRLAKAPSLEHFEKHCEVILNKFEKDEAAGLYRVTKIANQLIGNGELSSKRSEAGKKGASVRWQVPSVLPSTEMANAIDLPWQRMADSDSDSDSDKTSSSEQKNSDVEAAPSKKPKTEPSREATRLALLLKTEILRNKADYKITQAQERSWAVTADRMLRLDGRKPEEADDLIRWVQRDEFWMTNVLSMDTFREKFDQLALKKSQPARGGRNGKGDQSGAPKKPMDYTLTPDEATMRAGLEAARTAGARN
jgi:hypothetical protein